jgi:ATP-dependent HslUV protease, peptidase subunit HslV
MSSLRSSRIDVNGRILDNRNMNSTNGANHIRPHATTILAVSRGGSVAMAGDGQVTFGEVVLKHGARKIRILRDGTILAGFAGAVADALTLIEKFESQLKSGDSNMRKAAVELAKEWRTDRYLRRLEAQLLIAEPGSLLLLSGDGDVIEPDDGIAAIGSGAAYATAAARALNQYTNMPARELVEAAMRITAELCIYTNDHFTIESIGEEEPIPGAVEETASVTVEPGQPSTESSETEQPHDG